MRLTKPVGPILQSFQKKTDMETFSVTERKVAKREENSGPEAFFGKLHSSFLRGVKAAGGAIEHFFDMGGFKIRLCFAGSAMVPLITRALKHLECEPDSNSVLTICLWDSRSTGIGIPPPPWSQDDYLKRGEIGGYYDEHIYTHYDLYTGILSMLDLRQNIALYWLRDAQEFFYFETGAPLLTILNWWMGSHGKQMVHAAAVGTAAGGFLLVGKSGSGKSSTALACLDSKLFYAGDDHCFVETKPTPYAYSIFCSGKLSPKDFGRFPFLHEPLRHAKQPYGEKALFFLQEFFPQKIAKGFPVKAIFIPRITTSSETQIKKTSAAASLTALAPSTIFQLPHAGHEAFSFLSAFVKQVPAYTLELGTDVSGITRAIENFLLVRG